MSVESENFKEAWINESRFKTQVQREELEKTLNSCWNIRLVVGSFFPYSTSTSPNLSNIVADNTVNLLVM
jgi:hypothetical protein